MGIASLGQYGDEYGPAEEKINLPNQLVEMADTALYYAKTKSCIHCGYIEKEIRTELEICPECGRDLMEGRNRIEEYTPVMKA